LEVILSRASMMMTNLETLKISFALDIKLFEESVSRDIGTEGRASRAFCLFHAPFPQAHPKIEFEIGREDRWLRNAASRLPAESGRID